MFKDTHVFCKACENFQKSGFISKHKESLDNLLLIFDTHPSGDVHLAIHDLCPHFHKEHDQLSFENLTKKDQGKPIPDP
jgi:hypothetical protein